MGENFKFDLVAAKRKQLLQARRMLIACVRLPALLQVLDPYTRAVCVCANLDDCANADLHLHAAMCTLPCGAACATVSNPVLLAASAIAAGGARLCLLAVTFTPGQAGIHAVIIQTVSELLHHVTPCTEHVAV